MKDEREVTEWFDWRLEPPCPGIYQRFDKNSVNKIYWAKWDDSMWFGYAEDLQRAVGARLPTLFTHLPWRAALSGVFPWDTPPVHVGVYRRMVMANEYSKWSGRHWRAGASTPKTANRQYGEAVTQDFNWRGIQPWIEL